MGLFAASILAFGLYANHSSNAVMPVSSITPLLGTKSMPLSENTVKRSSLFSFSLAKYLLSPMRSYTSIPSSSSISLNSSTYAAMSKPSFFAAGPYFHLG